MSLPSSKQTEPQRKPWLTETALWGVVIAWGGPGVWGWAQSAFGPVVAPLIAISVCADVVGARMAVHAGASGSRVKAAACIALALGCIAWTGFSGKRALELADAQRQEPYRAALAERAAAQAVVARIDAAIDAVPALRSDIPAVRLRELQTARAAEIARLEPQRAEAQARLDAIPAPPPSPSPLPGLALWGAVALIEALKFLGFWAIGQPAERRQPGQVIQLTPGQALARRRWGDRQA
jgi:hypothetical protein